MKRILTIQDISCVGKCSLTVALPIISAMSVETAILPTAVLSTHTMFSNFTYKDLTDQVKPITAHWKKEGISFDAIYTGYLGSFEQIALMKELFREFQTEENLIFVDPAMADNGRLYSGFTKAFSKEMTGLCSQADLIVPNLTEASLMTGTEYKETYQEEEIKELLKRLSDLGAKISILTGVSLSEGMTGVMGYDREKGEYDFYEHRKHPVSYHGTGDIFSSTCVGALTRGKHWKEAIRIAADYTSECIRLTCDDEKSRPYGVNFEEAVPFLLEKLALS